MRKTSFAIFALVASILASTASAQIAPFGTMSGGASDWAAVPGCSAITGIASVVSGTFTCNPASVVNGTATTAGRSILTIRDTISGSSATSNFLSVTGTFPATLSAETSGALFALTVDNDGQIQNGLKVTIAGAGGSVDSAIRGSASNTGTYSVGVMGETSGVTTNAVGVFGYAAAGTNRVAGYFDLGTNVPAPPSSVGLYVNNATVASPVAIFADNGTAVLTVADGGATSLTSSLSVGSTISATTNQGVWLATGAGYPALEYRSTLTPDGGELILDTTSRGFHVIEAGDESFDFNNGACGTAACTDPGLIIHSAVQDTTQYNHQAAWGQAGGALKTLTESAATSVVRIPVAALEGTGGKLTYRVKAADATDVQIREGEIKFAVVNKAGTETCTLSGASEAADGSVVAASVGTLTYAITCDTTPANAVDIQFNAVSSLTQTTLNIQYFVTLTGVGQPARQ